MSLQAAWLRRGPLAWSLRPLAWLYGGLAGVHRGLYALGLRRAERLPVPVIVVGNVVAGGAGKTPVVAAIVEHLKARGLQPGIISRGYGRRGHDCREVTSATEPADAGDEPLLLARRCRVPVFVAPRRADAGRALLAAHPRVQVLVSDDGLQHHALARDLGVCVFDDRGTGNGWLLPAGPLREPWPRRVDLVLRPPGTAGIEGYGVERRLDTQALRADGTRRPLAELAREPVLALAGIARPEAFFSMLRAAGVSPAATLSLPDHHDFDAAPPAVPPGMAVVCTEKDAVKLWRHQPEAWAVPLSVAIEPAFWSAFDALTDRALSSPDGSQTA
ncbi:tetraacyldisaccharide 4'-kinase [Ramlibacter sp. MAHUQ-53]|uniref:tetraacyldisaccharide 4'-kinase n=1 Tax=unclassified Ramlibacter TaxID=2617605 RepID=UPI0036451559